MALGSEMHAFTFQCLINSGSRVRHGLHVAQVDLELTMQLKKMILNFWSSCLNLSSPGIPGLHGCPPFPRIHSSSWSAGFLICGERITMAHFTGLYVSLLGRMELFRSTTPDNKSDLSTADVGITK